MPDTALTNAPSSPTPSQDAGWYQRLYARVEAMSKSPYAFWFLMLVSVVDGSVFPVPPFVVMIPMVIVEPRKWWRLALAGTVASLLGGAIGYGIGLGFHDIAVHFLHVDLNATITRFGLNKTIGQLLGDKFLLLALLCSVLPTPFKVVAIGSGLVKVPFARFMMAAVLGRLARFFAVGGVLRAGGPSALKWIGMKPKA